ncbi:MAG: hypothetical protein QXL94_07150 [Candidatus Parvarchaeum sp.]
MFLYSCERCGSTFLLYSDDDEEYKKCKFCNSSNITITDLDNSEFKDDDNYNDIESFYPDDID